MVSSAEYALKALNSHCRRSLVSGLRLIITKSSNAPLCEDPILTSVGKVLGYDPMVQRIVGSRNGERYVIARSDQKSLLSVSVAEKYDLFDFSFDPFSFLGRYNFIESDNQLRNVSPIEKGKARVFSVFNLFLSFYPPFGSKTPLSDSLNPPTTVIGALRGG